MSTTLLVFLLIDAGLVLCGLFIIFLYRRKDAFISTSLALMTTAWMSYLLINNIEISSHYQTTLVLWIISIAGMITISYLNSKKASDFETREILKLKEYQFVVENSLDLTTVIKADGHIVFQSPSLKDILGFNISERLDGNIMDNIHPSSQDELKKNIDASFKDKDYHFEQIIRCKNKQGNWLYLETKGTASVDVYNLPIAILHSRDVTARVLLEKRFSRLMSIIGMTADLIAIFDSKWQPIYCNDAGKQLLGVGSDDDLKGIQMSRYFSRESLKTIIHQGIRTTRREGIWTGDVILTTRGRRRIRCIQLLQAHYDEQGKLEYYSTIIRDVSEQVDAMEELRTHRNLLQEVINNLPYLIYVKDIDGQFLHANNAVAETYSTTLIHLLKQSHRELHKNESEYALIDRLEQQVLNTEQSLSFKEMDYAGFKGSPKKLDGQIFPIRLENNSMASLTIASDVTHEVETTRRLEKLRKSQQKQRNALLQVALDKRITEGDPERAYPLVSESAAHALEVSRVSVWFLNDDKGRLECAVLFERDTGNFSKPPALNATDFPDYFDALRSGLAIDASEARKDKRTAEFRYVYLEPLNILSMLDAPIRKEGQVCGVLCFESVAEQRDWRDDEVTFAKQMADQISFSLSNQQLAKLKKQLSSDS